MSTSLKKLLLVSITLLLGVMSGGAKAAVGTNYDFSVSSFVDMDGNNLNYLLSGQFSTNTGSGAQTILSWSNLTFGASSPGSNNPSASYVGTIPGFAATTYDSSLNVFGTTGEGVPYPNFAFNAGINNSTSGVPYFAFYSDSMMGGILDCYESGCGNGSRTSAWQGVISVSPASSSGGAPEIDGSLAPKVGFLLGCLFLMFGRKKQNAESMLTA